MPIQQVLKVIQSFEDDPPAGIPLTFIWAGRFDGQSLRRDQALSNVYFSAIKRNLLINFAEITLPQTSREVCQYLLQETLGACQDSPLAN